MPGSRRYFCVVVPVLQGPCCPGAWEGSGGGWAWPFLALPFRDPPLGAVGMRGWCGGGYPCHRGAEAW